MTGTDRAIILLSLKHTPSDPLWKSEKEFTVNKMGCPGKDAPCFECCADSLQNCHSYILSESDGCVACSPCFSPFFYIDPTRELCSKNGVDCEVDGGFVDFIWFLSYRPGTIASNLKNGSWWP